MLVLLLGLASTDADVRRKRGTDEYIKIGREGRDGVFEGLVDRAMAIALRTSS